MTALLRGTMGFVGLLCAAAFVGQAHAQTLIDSQQIAMTRPNSGNTSLMRAWLGRSDGHLVSAVRGTSSWSWVDHGAIPSPGPLATTEGLIALAGVWYDVSSHHHERAFIVASDQTHLFEYDFDDTTSTGAWTTYTLPAGFLFSGQIGATAGLAGGTPFVTVVLQTNDASATLFRGVGQGSMHTLGFVNLGTGWDPQSQVAASASPDQTIWTFVARRTDGTAGFHRWTPSGWATGNFGSPFLTPLGWSYAIAQGQLSSSAYGFHLWATTASLSESAIRVGTATTTTPTSLSWVFINLGNTAAGGYGVAATTRPNGAYVALDGFIASTNGHLWRDSTTATSWPATAVDLGTEQEMSSNGGFSLAAMMQSGFVESRVLWLGRLGTAVDLYSEFATNYATPLLIAHGDSLQRRRIDSGSSVPHAESMMDDWQGHAIAAAIVRTGGAYVQAMWSADDGETWTAPTTIPATVGTVIYDYVTDPTVAMSSSGTGYVAALGAHSTVGTCGGTPDEMSVLLTSTTNGSTFSTPLVLGGGAYFSLDHPWMEIDRGHSPPRLHFAWVQTPPPAGSPSVVMHRCMDEGATCPTSSTPCCQAPCTTAPCLGAAHDLSTAWPALPAVAPTLTVGGDGGVYVSWQPSVCRLRSDLTACDAAPYAFTGALAPTAPFDILIAPSGHVIREGVAGGAWTLAAAVHQHCVGTCPSCGIVYYAFEQLESGGSTLDVYSSRGYYCISSHTWSWSSPVLLTTGALAGTDQFQPSLSVVGDGDATGDDTVFASWYDRREPCALSPFYTNRCIRARGAWSPEVYGAQYWANDVALQSGVLTDPDDLPQHCGDPTGTRRFIGDFHAHRSGGFHTHMLWSVAPEGGAAGTAQLWQSYQAEGSPW